MGNPSVIKHEPDIANGILQPPKKFKRTAQQDLAMHILGSDATDIGLGGGARSGKTFILVYAVVSRALAVAHSRHCILRFRQNSVIRSVVMDTFPKVMDLCYPGVYDAKMLNKTWWYYTMPNGSEIWFGGLDDKERVEKILGNEYATILFNECSQIPWQSVKLALTRLAQKIGLRLKAYYDFNPPSKRHWTCKVFIDRVSPETNRPVIKPESYAFLYMNPLDNAENLEIVYLERLDALPEKERKRFFLGQFSEEDNDALWTDEVLDYSRHLTELPDMVRIIIAVDPSGCEGDEDFRSDEIGIVVGGLGVDGKGYLMADLSGHYGPSEWARIVADAFENYMADRVVAESNYGGAMVQHTIATANEDIPVTMVRATRGKVVRAEPVSALYDIKDNRIKHAGHFPEIEEQLCSFYPDGYKGLKSPDRADAVIWLFTELFPGLVKAVRDPSKDWQPGKVLKNARLASAYTHRGDRDGGSRSSNAVHVHGATYRGPDGTAHASKCGY